MKKLFYTSSISTLIVFIITAGMVYQPTSAVSSPWDPEPFGISCYHEVDGVRDPLPYTMVLSGSCPPWVQQPEAPSTDTQIDQNKAALNLPPHLCREVGLPEW